MNPPQDQSFHYQHFIIIIIIIIQKPQRKERKPNEEESKTRREKKIVSQAIKNRSTKQGSYVHTCMYQHINIYTRLESRRKYRSEQGERTARIGSVNSVPK